MATCTKCGNAVSATDQRCTNCGAVIGSESNTTRQSRMATQQVVYPKNQGYKGKRPVQVMSLMALSLFSAVESFLFVGNVNLNPKIAELSSISSSLGYLLNYAPYFLEITGLLSLIAVFGYFKGDSWAWKVGLAASVFGAITLLAPNLLGFCAAVASLVILLTKTSRSWFSH
ncbi:MAG: zinc-ribbon domain-containing protein [Nitrososphaerales archaeon]